jgi:DNA-binding XRE family transcriptional regulator
MMAKAQERITTLATPAFQNKIRDARYLVGENRFAVTLDSGKEYVFPRSRMECDDGTDVVMVAVDTQRLFFHVTQASGNKYEIPWDRVLYECEASYPYFRKHGTRVESPQGLAKQIIRLRKAKGMTQRELARAARMLRPNLSRIEAGKHRPTLETLQKIANALNVPVVDLILRK